MAFKTLKTTPKISVKIWRPIIEKLDKTWPRDVHKFATSTVGGGLHLIISVEKVQKEGEPTP